MTNDALKEILSTILDRVSDLAASVDALELELVESGGLRKDAIHSRFQSHKLTVESHLTGIRSQISSL